MLFFFLCAVSDWGSPSQQRVKANTPPLEAMREQIKEKIVYELSVSNERLETENRQLRQEVLHLKRLYRNCRGGNATALASLAQRKRANGGLRAQSASRIPQETIAAAGQQAHAARSQRTVQQESNREHD